MTGISVDDIVALYTQREQRMGGDIRRMREVAAAYNNDIVLPLPEVDRDEKSAVANYIAVGIDQNAMRIADPNPNLLVHPTKWTKQARDRANQQRRALLGHLEAGHHKRRQRRRARWLLAYGSAPVVVRPYEGRTRIELRSPLHTFPSPGCDPDDLRPDDVIFTAHRHFGDIARDYPVQAAQLYAGRGRSPRRDEMFTVLEYVDCDEWVTVLVGRDPGEQAGWVQGSRAVLLERVPNRAGCCPAVIPGRVTLDRRQGQFHQVIGMYQEMAKLMALSVIATRKGIIRDEWLVAHPNEEPEIVSVPDAGMGIPGVVKGGSLIPRDVDPQFQTSQTLQIIDRSIRETSGVPTEFGGSSSSGTRTARRGAQLLSAAIDFPVAEAQEMFASSLEEECRILVATESAYFGAERRSFYVRWKGAKGSTGEFTPSEMWDDLGEVEVSYPLPGADTNSLVVEAGQRVGMGVMSKERFMEVDPLVDDVEAERDRVRAERVEDAFLTSIQTMAADPQGPWQPVDIARFDELVRSNRMELYEAAQQVQKEAQERQAAVEQAPEEMPGLSMPGMGVEAPPSVPPPEQGMQNLQQLLFSLTAPQQAVA